MVSLPHKLLFNERDEQVKGVYGLSNQKSNLLYTTKYIVVIFV